MKMSKETLKDSKNNKITSWKWWPIKWKKQENYIKYKLNKIRKKKEEDDGMTMNQS